MDRQHNSKLSLFLMELIVAIMFFSLSAAVCVRLFTSAHLLAEKTESLSNAVIWSQNLSEAFTGSSGDLESITVLYPEAYITTAPDDQPGKEGRLILFFNKDWELIESRLSDATYEAYINIQEEDASSVYSDVTDYGVIPEGKAMVGDIIVLNVEGLEEDQENVVEDESRIILKNKVDCYIGKGDE